jgi:hypothetical protein
MSKALKLPGRTLSAVGTVICGNPTEDRAPISPYRSGPDLVAFFNEFGGSDSYPSGGGFPSRWAYAEGRLAELNDTAALAAAVEASVHPAFFLGTPFSADTAAAYLNRFLDFDDLELRAVGKVYRLFPKGEALVQLETPPLAPRVLSAEFLSEQLAKCDAKLQSGDYDGSITNARSIVEAVLIEIECRLDPSPPSYDGDLGKLYKRVQKSLNLDPAQASLTDTLRQILSGLTSIVAGLGALRNRAGDAHARPFKPERHHAKLAANAAKTLVDFLFDTYEYQKRNGRITEIPPSSRAS